MGLGTWIANLATAGELRKKTEEADRAWAEFRAEGERTDWQAEQHAFHAMSRDAYRQVGQEQKAAASLMSNALEAGFDIMKDLRKEIAGLQAFVDLWRERAEFFESNATELNHSRRGWKWLYEQKMQEWAELVRYKRWYWEADKIITNIATERDDLCDQRDAALRMTKDWHETNLALQSRTSQGRDENYRSYQQERTSNLTLQSRLDDALLSWDEERARGAGWQLTAHDQETEIVALMGQVRQSDGNTQRVEAERDTLYQRLEIKETTIERLEGALKIATANDGRDSRGRFTSRGG